jgi:serine protease
MGLRYNVEMSGAHVRYFFFTLAAAAIVFTGRGHGQSPIEPRTFLFPYSLPAVDQGLMGDLAPGPATSAAFARRAALSPSITLDRTGSAGSTYVAGRVIVKFRDGTSTASRLNSLSHVSAAGAASERPSYANFEVVRIDPNDDAEAAAAALRQRPDVEYAQAAYRIHTQMVPNDQLYRLQWNLPMLDLERAWDIQGTAGSSITVAVLDSGIAFQSAVVRFNGQAFHDDLGILHPALGSVDLPFAAATDLFSSSRFVMPRDFIWDDNLPFDLDSHGTHVSGTIGQLTNNDVGAAGVAFNVKLMPVKVIDSDWDEIFGSPNQGTDDVVARGIRYAADNGAKVINMSIGRTGPPAPVIEDAVKYAVGKGAFIVIAAGNDFEDGNPTEVLAEIASRVQGAVSVAAVDRGKNHAYYSSTGSWVELAAPGGDVRSFGRDGLIVQQTVDLRFGACIVTPRACGVAPSLTAPRFDIFAFFGFQGTSMAAPHVSGLAAMLIQQGITSPAAVEAALERFAADLGDPGRDNVFGFGLVEARDTLRGLGLAR